MKKTVVGTAVALAWFIAAPFAQEQPAPGPQETPAHNVFVLTGCLKAGTEATVTFKLTDASSIGQRTPGETASAVGTSGQKATYELRPVTGVGAQGVDADKLKAQLGKRIEVVVRPVESPAPPPVTGLAVAQAAKPIEPAPARFRVTEIRRVIGSCL
jgi:hypothetical protein